MYLFTQANAKWLNGKMSNSECTGAYLGCPQATLPGGMAPYRIKTRVGCPQRKILAMPSSYIHD